MADRFVVVVDETKLVAALGPFGTPARGARLRPRRRDSRLREHGRRRGHHPTAAQRQRQPADGRPLRHHRPTRWRWPPTLAAVPGIVEHGIFPGAMVERVVIAGEDGVARARQRPAERCVVDPTGGGVDPQVPHADLRTQRARYWARAPTASLLRRLERCRPSSTNSTALATTAGDSSPPVRASTGSRSVGSSPRRST